MYLTQELANEKNPAKKKELLSIIKRGSIICWPYFNFNGEFDFSEDKLSDSLGFKMAQILREKLPEDEEIVITAYFWLIPEMCSLLG